MAGSSGAVGYSYPFSLPASRGRFQPALALRYSSNSHGGLAGVGWSVTTTFIERSFRASPDTDTGEPRSQYWLVHDGVPALLHPFPKHQTVHYRLAVQDVYLDVTAPSASDPHGAWHAVDSQGTELTFTDLFAGRRWHLTQASDVDGNTTDYSYGGEPEGGLLTAIRYNRQPAAHTEPGGPYASVVDLGYETRPDPQLEVVNGILVEHDQRLASVRVTNQTGPQPVTLLTYLLHYEQSPVTQRSLLASVEARGLNGAAGPRPTAFTYAGSKGAGDSYGYSDRVGINGPSGPPSEVPPSSAECRALLEPQSWSSSGCTVADLAAWIDIDGDRRPDLVWGGKQSAIRWARNTTPPDSISTRFDDVRPLEGSDQFKGSVVFGNSDGQTTQIINSFPSRFLLSGSRLMDFNGDGRPDLVEIGGSSPSCGPTALRIRFGGAGLNGAARFDAQPTCVDAARPFAAWSAAFGPLASDLAHTFGLSLSVRSGTRFAGPATTTLADLVDLTGDGLPDYVIAADGAWKVFPSYRMAPDGTPGFATVPREYTVGDTQGSPRPAIRRVANDGSIVTDVVDLNGDGLRDRVIYTPATHSTPAAPTPKPNTWKVDFNTGFGMVERPSHHAPPLSTPYWTAGDPTVAAIMQAGDNSADPLDDRQGNAFVYTGTPTDINADGMPEYVHKPTADARHQCPTPGGSTVPAPCPFLVSWNTGLSFATTKTTTEMPKTDPAGSPVDLVPLSRNDNGLLTDVNGDGMIDYVASSQQPQGQLWSLFAGTSDLDVGRPDILRSATSPLGARTTVRYAPSTKFSANSGAPSYPVAVEAVLDGPGLAGDTVSYSYENAVTRRPWYDPAVLATVGFTDSWSTDSTTGVRQHTKWNTTEPFAGAPNEIEQDAPVQVGMGPPVVRLPFRRMTIDWQAHAQNGTCTPDPKPDDYPIIPVAAHTEATSIEDGHEFTSTHTVDCPTVDQFGNITAVTEDPDSTLDGDERTTRSTFDSGSGTTCMSCPTSTSVHVGTVKDAVGKDPLAAATYFYDAPVGRFDPPPRTPVGSGHLNFIERWVAGKGIKPHTEVASKTSYNADGTVAAIRQVDPEVTTRFTYDQFHLHIDKTETTDRTTTLATETTYDQAGRAILQRGPYLEGDTSLTSQQRAYAYDGFGRILAIGREPPRDGVLPSAIAAFAYEDHAAPASIRTYQFAVPIDLTLGAAPVANEVRTSVSYVDALGRIVQTREALARGAPASDPRAQIVQDLDAKQFRVTNAVMLDGAGRITAQLDPYYSSTQEYQDYAKNTELATPGLHATLVSYDAQGRQTCQLRRPITGAIPKTACQSRFPDPDGTDYQSATKYDYGTGQVGSHWYRFVDILPAANNVQASSDAPATPTRQYIDAAGRLVFTRDAYQNLGQLVRDHMGNIVASHWWADDQPANSTPACTARGSYCQAFDTLGRVIEQQDPSFGTRIFRYLPSGQLSHQGQHPTKQEPDGTLGIDYHYASLGRLTETNFTSWKHAASGTWQRTSTMANRLRYDTPLTGRPGARAYQFTAGQVTAETTPVTTIALGYNQDGQVTNRDQWFAAQPNPAPHSVTYDLGNDGRLLATTVHLPELPRPVTYRQRYDSAGRVVQLDSQGAVWWRAVDHAPPTADTGAYDAAGRLGQTAQDDGRVTTVQTYASGSGMPTSATIRLGNTPLFAATSMRYQGAKLIGYREAVAATTYSMSYDRDGRLTQATASPTGQSGLGQQYDQRYSPFLSKTFGASAPEASSQWVLERVQETTAQAGPWDATYEYTGHSDGPTAITTKRGSRSTTTTLSYDAEGRLTKLGRSQRLTHDAANQLVGIEMASRDREAIAYDPSGAITQRVLTKSSGDRLTIDYVGSDATITVNQPQQHRAGADLNPASATVHVLLGGRPIASIRDGRTILYHRDWLGSVVATSLQGGRVGAAYRYDPYGQLTQSQGDNGPGASEFGYTGALRLTGGLLALGHRAYVPSLRIFVQPDDVDSLRYTYAGGDPVNRVDPTGHMWTSWNEFNLQIRPPGSCPTETFCALLGEIAAFWAGGASPLGGGSPSGGGYGINRGVCTSVFCPAGFAAEISLSPQAPPKAGAAGQQLGQAAGSGGDTPDSNATFKKVIIGVGIAIAAILVIAAAVYLAPIVWGWLVAQTTLAADVSWLATTAAAGIATYAQRSGQTAARLGGEGAVLVEEAIASGAPISARLEPVLRAIQSRYLAAAPASLEEAQALVYRAAESVGKEIGYLIEQGTNYRVFQQFANTQTTVFANGAITVTKNGEVVLRLLPK